MPLEPERTYRWLDYYFAPGTPPDWIEEMLAFDQQVGLEDRVLVEGVQQGVRSGMVETGVVVQSERLISHFQRLLGDALGL
jgi:choline monooxygenase